MGLRLGETLSLDSPIARARVYQRPRLLACFYGGVVEELLLRLFVMTLVAWLIAVIAGRGHVVRRPWVYVAASLIAAALFGAGHLPAAAAMWPLTGAVVVRVLALNAVPGFFYGLLYWRYGLEHAMLSHWCTDLVVHVAFGG